MADAASDVYADYVKTLISNEDARKASLEQRGVGIVATSSTLATLLFALVGVVTASKNFTLPSNAHGYLAVAIVLLAIAVATGLTANIPFRYQQAAPTKETFKGVWHYSPQDSQAYIIITMLRVLASARRSNAIKGRLVLSAGVVQLAALVALVLGVLAILNPSPEPANVLTLTAPYSSGVRSIAFTFDGRYLAAGDANGHVDVWQVSTHKLVGSMPDPGSKGVNSVAYSPGGLLLAAGDANGSIYLWNHQMVTTLTDSHSHGVRSIAFTFDGRYLAAGDANGHVDVWQVSTHKLVGSMPDPGSKGVNSVAYSPGGLLLAAGDANGSIYLWNHQMVTTLTDSHRHGVRLIAFTFDGRYLAAGDANGHIQLHKVTQARLRPAAANGSNRIALRSPGSPNINALTCLYDLY